MCGIVGIVAPSGLPDESVLVSMRDMLAHRGPDDCGLWVNPHRTIALASRRLAILDLSSAGHQPMVDEEADLAVVFNGEIYNFLELRRELEQRGHTFRSHSDTEVLLRAYREWGRGCLTHLNGMFAFALWDGRRGELFAARDRFGEKPLYYATTAAGWIFGSEIKALLQHPAVRREPYLPAVLRFIESARVPDGTDVTCFAGISQLPAAHALTIRPGMTPRLERYWDLDPTARVEYPHTDDYVEAFRALLIESVRYRLRSDVPVGSSLSGGLESSSLVGVIAMLSGEGAPARQAAFSTRFHEPGVDEGNYIRAVVEHTGIEAHEVWPDAQGLLADIDRWIWHQEEPCPHTSQYAQWKVMELARRNGVTVLLDGQGADELLGGYQAPSYGYRYATLLRRGQLATLVHELGWYRRRQGSWLPAIYYLGTGLIPTGLREKVRTRYHRANGLLSREWRRAWMPKVAEDSRAGFASPLKAELYRQLTRTSLPSLLRYGDRNSMAFSVEARLPFLDHRVAEFVFGVPDELLIHNGLTKVLLREAMRHVLPEPVYRRVGKLGFPTPENIWFRGELRGWLRGVLDKAVRRPFFDRSGVEQEWKRFLHGGDVGNLWRVAHTELWWERFFG